MINRLINLKKFDIQTKLLALFALFMPFSRLLNVNTIIVIILGLTFFYSLIIKKEKFIFELKNPIVGLLLYFFVVLFSLFYTVDSSIGFYYVSIWLFLFIPLGLHYKRSITKDEFRFISFFFILGNLIAVFYLFIYAFVIFHNNPTPLLKGFSYFTDALKMHPSFFSSYVIFAFSLYMGLFYPKSGNLFVKYFLWFLLFLLIFYIKSRAPIIIAFLIFLSSIFIGVNNKTKFVVFVILFLVVALFWRTFIDVISWQREFSMSIVERINIWKSSLEVIKNNLFFGVGVGDFQIELDKQYFLMGYDKGIDHKYNSHNQYLHILVSTGLVGLVSFLSIYYYLIKKQLKSKSFIILAFVILSSVLMFFDVTLLMLHGVYFFSFFATLLLKLKTNAK